MSSTSILCGKRHSDKTERRNAIMASCQAMGIEDAEASVIHEFDSCKRAGCLTGLPWRLRAGNFATGTSDEEAVMSQATVGQGLHTAHKARSG